MSFTIPNRVDATFRSQAEPDSRDFKALAAGIAGAGVISGCAVTAQATPDNTVAVASGTIALAGATATVAGGNVTIGSAQPADPRFDLILADAAGALSAVQGTHSPVPAFPNYDETAFVVLAAVYVSPGSGNPTINANQIVDKRVIRDSELHAESHPLGGAPHTADTLANLNAKVSDATLGDMPNHEAAADPHPTYETSAEAQAKVDTHAAEVDPHTVYQKESEKGVANGYAGLDAGGTVPDAQIPAAITRDTEAVMDGDAAGGELGGTYPNPTVAATHSGSAHHTRYTDAEAVTAVPYVGYLPFSSGPIGGIN